MRGGREATIKSFLRGKPDERDNLTKKSSTRRESTEFTPKKGCVAVAKTTRVLLTTHACTDLLWPTCLTLIKP